YGRDHRRAALHEIGKVHRKAGAGEDDIDPLFHGGLHQIGEIAQSYHYIDAENSASKLPRSPDFPSQPAKACPEEIPYAVVLEKPDPGSGYDTDASRVRRGGGQTRKRNAHAHPALHDRDPRDEIPELETFQLQLDHLCS